MDKLSYEDLMSLEEYDRVRDEFRGKMVEHKKNRVVSVGGHMTVHFEDRMTMHYQVQEMLRSERIFEREGIREELDAYNPLIPEGADWRATMMIEYGDPEERRVALARLVGIEREVWVRVGEGGKIFAVCNEDLERTTEDKTSAVHFMRWSLSPDDVRAAKGGAPIRIGSDHEHYATEIEVADGARASLVADLD